MLLCDVLFCCFCRLECKVETQTKMRDAAETVTVSLNYTEWMQEFADKGTCTYKGTSNSLAVAPLAFYAPAVRLGMCAVGA